jgi:hypothetical protein
MYQISSEGPVEMDIRCKYELTEEFKIYIKAMLLLTAVIIITIHW